MWAAYRLLEKAVSRPQGRSAPTEAALSGHRDSAEVETFGRETLHMTQQKEGKGTELCKVSMTPPELPAASTF